MLELERIIFIQKNGQTFKVRKQYVTIFKNIKDVVVTRTKYTCRLGPLPKPKLFLEWAAVKKELHN